MLQIISRVFEIATCVHPTSYDTYNVCDKRSVMFNVFCGVYNVYFYVMLQINKFICSNRYIYYTFTLPKYNKMNDNLFPFYNFYDSGIRKRI